VFHLFTHAFFKALLFLTAGSVMHALSGQLDMRKFSGLFRKMPVTGVLMLIGCLALAGFPFTAGYYSKDQILVDALVHPTLGWLGWVGIATALLTAFYTFRLWFRVFMGETKFEMGHEHHGYETDHPPDDHAHGPHEMGWLMNGPLVVLAIGALIAGLWLGGKKPGEEGWMYRMVSHSTAAVGKSTPTPVDHAIDTTHGSADPHGAPDAIDQHSAAAAVPSEAHDDHHAGHDAMHTMVSWLAGGGAIVMILLAGYFHWVNPSAGEAVARMLGPVVILFNRKWYVDELYHAVIVLPLRALAWVCYLFDRVVIDGLVLLIAWLPRGVADVQRPAQSGQLQGYALSMCIGIGLIIAIVLFVVVR
jgi:NADH-quinone oxidoreductase subunit L